MEEKKNSPRPVCVLYSEELSQEAIVLNKLERHRDTKYLNGSRKDPSYFARLLEQSEKLTVERKMHFLVLDARFKVAELICQNLKLHLGEEEIICPACQMITESVLGKEAKYQVSEVRLSDNTITHRVS